MTGDAPSAQQPGRLSRRTTHQMDVLATLNGYCRLGYPERGGRWSPCKPRAVNAQPDASFPDIRRAARILERKGLALIDRNYWCRLTPAGAAEWNRLWPESPSCISETPGERR